VRLLSEYHASASSTMPQRKIATPTAGTPQTGEIERRDHGDRAEDDQQDAVQSRGERHSERSLPGVP
jgi:hypothetical protein